MGSPGRPKEPVQQSVLVRWPSEMNGVCSARVTTWPFVVGSPVQFEGQLWFGLGFVWSPETG